MVSFLGIDDDLKKQVSIREEACARMLLDIAAEAKRISQLIVDEQKLRIKKMNTLDYDLKHEEKSQSNFNKTFCDKTMKEFNHFIDNLTKEMDNRFDH